MSKTVDDFSRRLAALSERGAAKTPANTSPSAVQSAPPAPQETDEAPDAQQPADEPRSEDAAPVGSGEYLVKPGDCISSIARSTGHFWQRLWDEPANAELKQTRRQPNVLLEGDRVYVPELQPKREPGDTEKRHRFIRRGEPSHFAVRVLDQDVPRANEPYTLVIDERHTITGFTDPEGKLDVPIPGNARRAVLTVGEAPDLLKLTFNLGNLEPVESWAGVQARLKNMGYACDETGEGDAQTLDALNEFRAANGLPASEDVDDATRTKLLEIHGS